MRNQKLTPWFPISTPPVRVGVYNVSCHSSEQTGLWYANWNGTRFGWYSKSKKQTGLDKYCNCSDVTKSWRGIAK